MIAIGVVRRFECVGRHLRFRFQQGALKRVFGFWVPIKGIWNG